MKSFILAATMTLAFSANAHMGETEVRYVGDTEYAGFCRAVVENDVTKLKSRVAHKVGKVAENRRAVVRKLVAEDGMACNGDNLIAFSEKYGADEVSSYLKSML